MNDKEPNIIIHDGIGIRELRHLAELSALNKALNQEEFMLLVSIYKRAIDRLALQAEKEGIKI